LIPDIDLIRRELASRGLFPAIEVYDVTDSTNTRARALLEHTESDILVIASEQTGGKGSHGRSFYSPMDTGLYFSAGYRSLGGELPVTFAAAAASVRALGHFGTQTSVKWVNDLILSGRKAGGILCERTAAGDVIVGIGINLTEPEGGFPEEISGIAAAAENSAIRRDELAAVLYKELTEELGKDAREIMDDYRVFCETAGRRITFDPGTGRVEAYAVRVEDNGALLIRMDDGTEKKLGSGNVSIRNV